MESFFVTNDGAVDQVSTNQDRKLIVETQHNINLTKHILLIVFFDKRRCIYKIIDPC